LQRDYYEQIASKAANNAGLPICHIVSTYTDKPAATQKG
jgi:hypothetical protein